jgi:hypothetical protein
MVPAGDSFESYANCQGIRYVRRMEACWKKRSSGQNGKRNPLHLIQEAARETLTTLLNPSKDADPSFSSRKKARAANANLQ